MIKSIEINLMIKRILISTLVILNFNFASSHNPQKEEILIQQYLNKAKDYGSQNNFLKYLEYSKKANELALKNNNSKRITESYYNMSLVLSILGLKKESLYYAEQALKQDFAKNDNAIKTKLLEIKVSVYGSLNMYDAVIQECNKIIELIPENDKDAENIITLANAYVNKGTAVARKTSKIESYIPYQEKGLSILKKHPEKLVFEAVSQSYLNKASVFTGKQYKDSAISYINKAFYLRKKYNSSEYAFFSDINYKYGEYYYYIKDYQKSLENFLKVIEEQERTKIKDDTTINTYKAISKLYGLLHKPEKEKEYLSKYIELNDKEKLSVQKDLTYALKIISKENENEIYSTRKYIIIISVLFLITVALILYYFLSQKKKSKIALKKKEIIIQQKEKEYLEKENLHSSYEKLVQMAKENNPEFFGFFQNIYPDFRAKMLLLNSELKISELTLCAYIYLGFSTKDIAEYTFKAVKTIENNKYNLRKRINAAGKTDFSIWIRNYIDNL